MFRYRFTAPATKQFLKLPQDLQHRILRKLDFFCQEHPLVYAEKLTGHKLGSFRFRIGDWRVVFDIKDQYTLLIMLVGHRRDIYR